jgi:hypothetical protein
VRSRALTKWQKLTPDQRDMLTEAICSVCGPEMSFEEFAETARSFMESIAGLETLTEHEASRLVNQLWRDYMAKKPSKTKQAEKPVEKQKKDAAQEAPAPKQPEAPKQAEAAAEPKKVDLDKPAVKKAIDEGLAVLKDGKSKADAAWAIYGRLKDEDKDLIVAAFIKGATLTEKGALTYWYNCKRKAAKEAPAK